MNYLPPLRNNQQMVRVVQESGNTGHATAMNFKLANAFGDHQKNGFNDQFGNGGLSPTEQQIRTLDAINLPSSSLRRPAQTANGGMLPMRASSSLFHYLNHSTRNYMNGMGGGQTMSRNDAEPGTKLRTQLSPNADTKMDHSIQNRNIRHNQNDHRLKTSYTSDSHLLSTPHNVSPKKSHTSSSHSSHSGVNS